MELKETNHPYYCSINNFYVGNHNNENWGRGEFSDWKEFKSSLYYNGDKDLNLLFRFDICQKDDDNGNLIDSFYIELFYILQRKGIFAPVFINSINKNNMDEIEFFLKERYEYLKGLWFEFNV
jgi:hypothetical protein